MVYVRFFSCNNKIVFKCKNWLLIYIIYVFLYFKYKKGLKREINKIEKCIFFVFCWVLEKINFNMFV